MEDKKIISFIVSLLFKGWKNSISFVSLLGIVGFFLAPAMNESWKIKDSIIISLIIILILFVIKVFRQYYFAYVYSGTKSQAVRIVAGDGLYKGNTIIVFNVGEKVKKGEILTMYCESSGTRQPICLIRVLDVTENEIISIQYPYCLENINKYFEEDSRRKETFILKTVDYKILEKQILNGGE